MFSAVGLIPARYGSRRLPGKPLADLQGKPLLYYVYQRAKQARSLDNVWIATDDDRIAEAAKGFGAPVVMTGSGHRSGTDRIAEAVREMSCEIVVNIQGDEPLLDSGSIDQVVDLLKEDSVADMATLKCLVQDVEELLNPNVVKVVTDRKNHALYFSRSPIPYGRVPQTHPSDLRNKLSIHPELLRHSYRHIGIYAYRYDFLMRLTRLAPTPLEQLEDLEQLRALESGAKIKVGVCRVPIHGIDTPEDLERIRKLVGNDPELLKA
jgi:3-deoxy-manno-octulosonate cytidylyltransferase (CMP-KDO synthetase)